MKPGITGWAQVNGRNALSWDEHIKLDLWYIDNHSMLLDIRILTRTLAAVITMKGNSQHEKAKRKSLIMFKENEN